MEKTIEGKKYKITFAGELYTEYREKRYSDDCDEIREVRWKGGATIDFVNPTSIQSYSSPEKHQPIQRQFLFHTWQYNPPTIYDGYLKVDANKIIQMETFISGVPPKYDNRIVDKEKILDMRLEGMLDCLQSSDIKKEFTFPKLNFQLFDKTKINYLKSAGLIAQKDGQILLPFGDYLFNFLSQQN